VRDSILIWAGTGKPFAKDSKIGADRFRYKPPVPAGQDGQAAAGRSVAGAFGKIWDDALVDWLATYLPGSIVLPEGYDPGAGGDPFDVAGTFAHRDEVRGEGL